MEFTDVIEVGEILRDEENLDAFLSTMGKEFRVLQGYLGCYARFALGNVEYNLHLLQDEDRNYQIIGIDSHAMGNCIWHVLFAGAHFLGEEEGEENEEDVLSKCVFCTSFDERDGSCVPVTLVHVDVLPCYEPGEPVAMQVAAFPNKINYYPDEETCDRATMVENADGLKFVFGNGRMLTLYGIDALVKGTVKSVEHHETVTFIKGKPEKKTYCYVVVDTQFGPLPLCHSEEKVPEEERQWIRKGACLMTNCVISGDVAIGEYHDGAVYDEIHDLKLIRQCFLRKDFARAAHVFADEEVCVSVDFRQSVGSGSEIQEKLQRLVSALPKEKKITNRSRIVRIEDYIGEKKACRNYIGHLAVVFFNKEGVSDFLVVETNKAGKVSKIYSTRDQGFRVSPIDFVKAEDLLVLQPILSEKNEER